MVHILTITYHCACAGYGQDTIAGMGATDHGRGAFHPRADVPQGADKRSDALQRYRTRGFVLGRACCSPLCLYE